MYIYVILNPFLLILEDSPGRNVVDVAAEDWNRAAGESIMDLVDMVDGVPINDFGYGIQLKSKGSLTTDQIKSLLNSSWKPSIPGEFPESFHMEKGQQKNRRANHQHLKDFPWLVISRHPDYAGCWCSYCVLFNTNKAAGGQQVGHLIASPLTKFKDLTGKSGAFSRHNVSQMHIECSQKAFNFRITSEKPSADVRNALNTDRMKQVESNRKQLSAVIDTLKLCGVQNISLRGHRDDGNLFLPKDQVIRDENDGNFRHLLRFRVAAGDEEFKWNYEKGMKKNATYDSKTIQNELLGCIGGMIKEKNIERIKTAIAWVIYADETTDRKKRELMVLVIRYLFKIGNEYVLREDPIAVFDALEKAEDFDVCIDYYRNLISIN